MADKIQSVPELIERYPDHFQPQEAEGVDGVIQLRLSGEGGGHYYLQVKDQALTIEEGEHPDPDTTIKTSAETWLAINNGDANPMAMMMQGKAKVEGSLPMAMKMQSLFKR